MRVMQRLASAGAMVAVVISMAACGVPDPNPNNLNPRGAAPPGADTNTGVTIPIDVFGAGCANLPQGYAPGSLQAVQSQPVLAGAEDDPMLTTLATSANAAGLTQTLNYTEQAITVFAPDNAAFADLQKSLGAQRFNALLADKNALGNILKYHVLAARNSRQTLVSAGAVPTLAGGTLQIRNAGPTISVTDGSGATATVLCGNIPTANAVVYVIDKVLMPNKM